MQEFKVGDRVKILSSIHNDKEELTGKEGVITNRWKDNLKNEVAKVKLKNGQYLNFTVDYLEKIEDKPQVEPFELKEGMKVKFVKKGLNDYYSEKIMKADKVLLDCIVVSGVHLKNEYIDWEATRKLNEVKEEPKTAMTEEERKEFARKLQIEAHKVLGTEDYDLGFSNGLELALAITEKREPVFKTKEYKEEKYSILESNNPEHKNISLETAEAKVESLIKNKPNSEYTIVKIIKIGKGIVNLEWEEL